MSKSTAIKFFEGLVGATTGSLLKSKLIAMMSPESDMMAPVEVLNVPMMLPEPSLTVIVDGAIM